MHRPGSGPGNHTLRGMSGFPSQQPQAGRVVPSGITRLQNGKLGNATSWGFGMPNGAHGLPGTQSRVGSNPSTSFAQSLGGTQPSTPLDLSEFPSLSGAPQSSFQNPGQAVWANANQRAIHTPVQRPQPPIEIGTGQQPSRHGQDHGQHPLNDTYFPASQLEATIEDYRHTGLSGLGQLSSVTQPPSESVEEFPPLGRNGQSEGMLQDRRMGLMQHSTRGAFSNPIGFGPGNLASRNLVDTIRTIDGTDEKDIMPLSSNGINHSIFDSLTNPQTNALAKQQHIRGDMQARTASTRQIQQGDDFGTDVVETMSGSQPRPRTPPDQMNEIDRFGLRGLLEALRNGTPEARALAIGQELRALGLELDSIEPLHSTFAGPFAKDPAKANEPDFGLPACYAVHNTHRLEEKAPSFSDETLFYMFFTMPRDAMQEVAAIELTHRNWRYHKAMKQWITKDTSLGEPATLSSEHERGRYILFNEKQWQRESRELTIFWADLDDHLTHNQQSRLALPPH